MLSEKIKKNYPSAEIVGVISPPYRELTLEEESVYVTQINNVKA